MDNDLQQIIAFGARRCKLKNAGTSRHATEDNSPGLVEGFQTSAR